MARARIIKPGFYANEQLAECSLLARFIFPGLWMLADRRGRLEDRPKRIKGELLRYDDGDMEALLDELVTHGLIVRYGLGSMRLIQIVSFEKHQNCHVREPESCYPSPDGVMPSTGIAPELHQISPAEAEAEADTEADTEAERVEPPKRAASAGRPRSRPNRLPADWVLPEPWREWALAERRDWSVADALSVAARFHDHWLGLGTSRADWLATWRNWVRREKGVGPPLRAITQSDKRAVVAEAIFGGRRDDAIDGTAERVA